jgi:antirestriction protein ArdC
MSKAIYDAVTATIIEQLEKGAAPWVKPWTAGVDQGADRNMVTGKPYQGINRLILGMSGFNRSAPVWATYKQWQDLGGNVKKGEKGTAIVFFTPHAKGVDKESGEEKTYMLLKQSFVFNVDQVDGIEIKPKTVELKEVERDANCEAFIKRTGANISHGGDSAFYTTLHDAIKLPFPETFVSMGNYYATAFHELVHWTGNKTRLERKFGERFGNPEYAFEELVAEMGAAFLCQDYSVQGELRHAGYIGHWLKACKEDNKAIFKAAALAQKAADYLNSLGLEEEKIAA